MDAALVAAIDEWLAIDPDAETRAELEELRERATHEGPEGAAALADLSSRFSGNLEFGTAGLRGELGAGPNRMNRVVVQRAAWALGQFLLANRDRFWADRDCPLVVVGYDGRTNSDVFASDSVAVLSGLGVEARLFRSHVPTPVLAFTGHRLASSASVMVTASHNPPRDNGYKVYLGGANGGSQLISPDDKAIAELIAQFPISAIPSLVHGEVIAALGFAEVDAYVERAEQIISGSPSSKQRRAGLKICHTSLHGVGWQVVDALFARVGFSDLHPVVEQVHPDGRFPTVSFPNPEEPGAMDLAFETASRIGADLVLANDPDADRLAVAIPDHRMASGWRMFSGDQVGLMLGWITTVAHPKGTIANSIVSSARLGKIATHFGVKYQQTLTGFKWISKVPELHYGYEEALGYCVDPTATPDKDGITAGLLIAEAASALKEQGKSLDYLLGEIDKAVGAEATSQISMRVTDLNVIATIMKRLRSTPPARLLDEDVRFTDLMRGGSLPATDGIVLETESGLRVTVRPSGTEPKLKCYLSSSGKTAKDAEARMVELRAAVQQLLN